MKVFIRKIFSLPKKIVIKLITLYQRTLSPDHGWFKYRHPHGFCRYRPTCSEYSKQAFRKYGFFKGLYLSFWRIIRCNPWSGGGTDELK